MPQRKVNVESATTSSTDHENSPQEVPSLPDETRLTALVRRNFYVKFATPFSADHENLLEEGLLFPDWIKLVEVHRHSADMALMIFEAKEEGELDCAIPFLVQNSERTMVESIEAAPPSFTFNEICSQRHSVASILSGLKDITEEEQKSVAEIQEWIEKKELPFSESFNEHLFSGREGGG